MKQILPIALVVSMFSGSLVHARTDDDLLNALQDLKGRVMSATEDEQKAKIAAISVGTQLAMIGGTFAGIAYLHALGPHLSRKHQAWLRRLPHLTTLKAFGLPAIYFTIPLTTTAAVIYQSRALVRRAGLKGTQTQTLDIHTAEGMKEFWTLPVETQYALASRDEAFARYLIEFNRLAAQAELGYGIPQPLTQAEPGT